MREKPDAQTGRHPVAPDQGERPEPTGPAPGQAPKPPERTAPAQDPEQAGIDAEATIRSLRRSVRTLQLILTALAFLAAMNSTMMAGSWGFILWYAVLGGVAFYFYRNLWPVLLLTFVPAFVWMLADQIGAGREGGFGEFLVAVLAGSLLTAGLHTLFALIGVAVVWLAEFRKILPRVLAAALALGVLIFYDGFNGNPASRWLAEQTVRSYLATTYPDRDLVIRDGGYNFKSGAYEFRVVAAGTRDENGQPEEYWFMAKGVIPKLKYDPISRRDI